jgi:LysM repeat protein
MPARAAYNTYTVVKGDTLAKIAARFGSSVQAIAVASGIADPNKIEVGQELLIPTAAKASPATKSSPKMAPKLPDQPPAAPKGTDSSPGTPAGIGAWFQPPRLWFTIGALATIAYALFGKKRRNKNL